MIISYKYLSHLTLALLLNESFFQVSLAVLSGRPQRVTYCMWPREN